MLAGIPDADDSIVATLRGWRYRPLPLPLCFEQNLAFRVECRGQAAPPSSLTPLPRWLMCKSPGLSRRAKPGRRAGVRPPSSRGEPAASACTVAIGCASADQAWCAR